MSKRVHFQVPRLALHLLLCVTGVGPCLVEAAHHEKITQPIGDLVRVWEVEGSLPLPLQPPSRIPPFTTPTTPLEEVNYIAAQWDFNVRPDTVPFDQTVAVTEIVLTKPQNFVRLLDPAAGSTANGPYMARSEYVRGLTPEQLKDRFALPTTPTDIIQVELPASPDPTTGKEFALWTGVAAPVAEFGQGGGVQNRIIADFNGTHYFPDYAYAIGVRNHQQPIGKYALSYRPMAGKRNTQRVAAYLDHFIPEAYSDLEDVYTILDFLNFVDFGPEPLRHALNQMSPQNYLAIPFVETRNALLFGNAVLDRCCFLRSCRNFCCEASLCDTDACCGSSRACLTFQAVGEFMKQGSEQHQTGFWNETGAGILTFDYQCTNDFVIGLSAAGMDNYLKWHKHRGNAHIASAKGGLYASYCPVNLCSCARFYLDGLITGGYSWTKAHRFIEFPGVDRDARSRQTGYDFAAHLQGGCDLTFWGWDFSPLAKISYFYAHQNGFSEHGAESLNLKVKGFNAETLRTNVGLGIARGFNFCCVEVIPQIYVSWVHDCFIGGRSIKSRLEELAGSFSVHGFDKDRDGFLGSACLLVQFGHGISADVSYDIETEKRFISQKGKLAVNWCF